MKKWLILFIVFAVLGIGIFVALTQTNPTISKSATFKLNIIAKPDFSLVVAPLEIHTPYQRTVSFTVSVTSILGFVGEVTFVVTDIPVGITVVILPSDTLTLGLGETKGVQLQITIPDDSTLMGWHTLTITANSDTYN